MLGVLVAMISFTLVVAVSLAVLVVVTVAPVFVSLQMAEARRFSMLRWFTLSAGAVVLGVGYAYELHRHAHLPTAVTALPLLLTWAGPAALWLLEERQERIGGRAGRHE